MHHILKTIIKDLNILSLDYYQQFLLMKNVFCLLHEARLSAMRVREEVGRVYSLEGGEDLIEGSVVFFQENNV